MRSAARPRILLVEDVRSLQMVYRAALQSVGYSVDCASTAAEARRLFLEHRHKIALIDLILPDGEGIDLIREFLRQMPDVRVITITANASINKAVAAMRAGAHDFLVKPFDDSLLVTAVENARQPAEGEAPVAPAPATALADGQPYATGAEEIFIGSSEPMHQVQRSIDSVAPSMATVFITGESGTGKELCAQAIHAQSPRADGPFIALNCGAIPHDLLESEVFGHIKGSFTGAISDKPGAAAAADGGTLFLDEICEMAPALQTKLLRFLQTSTVLPVGATRPRKVNVRIICATNRDPLEAVRMGDFREDLFFRLYVVPLHMPALRDRGEDVIEIAKIALERFSREEGRQFTGMSPEVADIFRSYDWPGNIRQLFNVMRNIVVLNRGGIVAPEMLPNMLHRREAPEQAASAAPLDHPAHWPGSFVGKSMAQIEREVIEATVARFDGSVTKAARVLELSPSTIYRKLESWQRS